MLAWLGSRCWSYYARSTCASAGVCVNEARCPSKSSKLVAVAWRLAGAGDHQQLASALYSCPRSYAKTAGKDTRNSWLEFTKQYFLKRRVLVAVMLLADASIPPQQMDLDCGRWLADSLVRGPCMRTGDNSLDRSAHVKNNALGAHGGKRAVWVAGFL